MVKCDDEGMTLRLISYTCEYAKRRLNFGFNNLKLPQVVQRAMPTTSSPFQQRSIYLFRSAAAKEKNKSRVIHFGF